MTPSNGSAIRTSELVKGVPSQEEIVSFFEKIGLGSEKQRKKMLGIQDTCPPYLGPSPEIAKVHFVEDSLKPVCKSSFI
jgi:hypothetical protein